MGLEKTSYLSTLRDMAFVGALYLYFLGWIYCYYYLISFGVGIRQAGIEIYSVIIYSTAVFSYYSRTHSFLFWAILLMITGIIFLLRFLADKKKEAVVPKFILTIFLLSLFVIAFPIARHAGTQTAALDKVVDSTSLPRIYVGFTKEFLNFEATNLRDSSSYFQKLSLYNMDQLGKLFLLLSADGNYLCASLGHPTTIFYIKKEIIEYAYIYK